MVTHPVSRGPGRPPAAKADETRKRIVRAARKVFSQHGYDGTTFQAVAVRADLTRPAINHYFSSKQALYREVVERTNELVVSSGIERARGETTLIGRITAFIAVAVEADTNNPSTAAFLATAVLESQRHPELNHTGNGAVGASREFLTWAVNDAMECGELTPSVDASSLVETLLVVLCGLGFYAGFIGSYQQIEAVTEAVRQLLASTL